MSNSAEGFGGEVGNDFRDTLIQVSWWLLLLQYDDAEDNDKGGLNAVRVSLLWSDPCCHLLLCNTMVYQWLY